ncbi:uncharacterized protein Dwil_GK16468 [Drosophila willistoni]|uniref:Uncharacterized protein n=1 Tax=Drosophila willistoni TaxID=7260 RepID=B4N2B0_DROWI|nr:uncharacterized protein Dwil_GK16468 [Drosophila willistoni]
MRFYLLIALTLALLLQLVAGKIGGPANAGHHHSTTVASLHGNVGSGSGSVAGSPPPGPPPSGRPPGPPRTTASSG